MLRFFPARRPIAVSVRSPSTPRNFRYKSLHTAASAGNSVNIAWDDPSAVPSRFHNIWLRDHCRCPKCFHPVTKQRLFSTCDIPRDIQPNSIQATSEGLSVTWPDGAEHVSLYPWSWLQRNSYDPQLQQRKPAQQKVLWGPEIMKSPPSVTYEEVMHDDKGVYHWLSNVFKYGFSFVSGVPPTPEATEQLSTRIAFIRETQYGKFWDFTSDLAKGDTAYTTLALGAHTDNTYLTDPCGLQLFHLLSHTDGTGGKTLLVDGFKVASVLRTRFPTSFQVLSSLRIRGRAAGEPDYLYTASPFKNGYPVITLEDGSEEVIQVRWNGDDRSVLRDFGSMEGEDKVERVYDAFRDWERLLRSEELQAWVQLKPGTAVVVDNHRVLHGRSAFTGKRRMCGAYIGMDEYKSRLAVLKERYEDARIGGTTKSGRDIWHDDL